MVKDAGVEVSLVKINFLNFVNVLPNNLIR